MRKLRLQWHHYMYSCIARVILYDYSPELYFTVVSEQRQMCIDSPNSLHATHRMETETITDQSDLIGSHPGFACAEPSFPQSINSNFSGFTVSELVHQHVVDVLPEDGVGDLGLKLCGERGRSAVRRSWLLL